MTEQEFENAVIDSYEKLVGYALTLTRDENSARDLVQETMFKVFKNSNQFSENADKTKLKNWLITIAHNEFINEYRKRRNRVSHCEVLPHHKVENAHPDSYLIMEDIWRRVQSLPKQQKIAVELFAKGMYYREIAEILSKPIGTVKSIIHNGRKNLKYAKDN